MKLLLDQDVPIRLRHVFPDDFDVETVYYRGLEGLENGDLLRVAQEEFEVLLTLDTSLQDQQNLDQFDLVVALLQRGFGRYQDLLPLIPRLIDRLRNRSSDVKFIHITDD